MSDQADPNTPLADRFDHPVEIRPDDIDANGDVNNVVYIRWIQETAVAHWFAVVEAERARSVLWVVTRHEVDDKRPDPPGGFAARPDVGGSGLGGDL